MSCNQDTYLAVEDDNIQRDIHNITATFSQPLLVCDEASFSQASLIHANIKASLHLTNNDSAAARA